MRRRARSGQKHSIGPRALVVAATVLAACGDDSCRPDSSCEMPRLDANTRWNLILPRPFAGKANRICEFSYVPAVASIP